ncbi:hypothetical protein HDK90DRAFT_525468 [Phyllosticta capitalensis]|uniref:Uncharacterized protein n=1 Tax=Phyllosticta capitalensis TaxID=121624 RepID=A0ABR1YLB1_9PEZI
MSILHDSHSSARSFARFRLLCSALPSPLFSAPPAPPYTSASARNIALQRGMHACMRPSLRLCAGETKSSPSEVESRRLPPTLSRSRTPLRALLLEISGASLGIIGSICRQGYGAGSRSVVGSPCMDAANGGELTGGLGCLNGPFPAALQRLIMESKWKWGRRLSRREGEKEKGSATVKPYGLRAKPTNHSKCAQVYNISTRRESEATPCQAAYLYFLAKRGGSSSSSGGGDKEQSPSELTRPVLQDLKPANPLKPGGSKNNQPSDNKAQKRLKIQTNKDKKLLDEVQLGGRSSKSLASGCGGV